MLKNYFTIAWRNMVRHKMYATINILGLALGMTCCLFIFLWIQDEKSVDRFHRNGEQLYTVYQTITADGKTTGTYSTPILYNKEQPQFMLEDITAVIPEIQCQAFYATGYELPWGFPETFRAGEKKLKLEGARAGKDFFKLFSYPIIQGNATAILQNMNGIAISRKMAELFFGSPAKAMGQTLRYENKRDFIVTGVFENLPAQSSHHFDFLFNWDAHKKLLDLASNNFQTYIRLSPGANREAVEAKLNRLLQSRMPAATGVSAKLGLQLFGDQYLHSHFVNGRPAGGRIEYVRLFSGVAIFILVIACINFMNLATARSVKRAKEVGLRKVVGSSRVYLVGQFLGESTLFACSAMLLSVLLLFALLPLFNMFTGKHIGVSLAQPAFWLVLAAITLFTGLVAGSYPAFYLSSLRPVRVLKGVLRFTRGAVWFRKGLTVFQFSLSIVLLIATIVICRQTYYVQNTHLGYDKENLVYIRIEGELAEKNNYLLFKKLLTGMPGIAMVDRSTEAPHAMDFAVADAIDWQGKPQQASVSFKPSSVGFDFVKLMGLQIAEGRDFSRAIPTDSTDAFMVNEEAVRQMGLKNPIGKWVSAWKKKGHIIAVLKDYHTHSLREPIKPLMIDVKEYEYFGVILVRTRPGATREALASMEKVYKEVNPGYPFSCQFVDQEYKKLYNNEQVMSRLSVLFATLAIVISCLGLLGLVMFAAEQRTKEVSIRKVLGASFGQIIALFSRDFLQLVWIAFVVAAPLAWLAMHRWLEHFAYRITVSWWIFALAGFTCLTIALLTISIQAVKTATANPVKSLRNE
jgi:ABC-type antimicrobial peptide transport system permease subunit